MDLKIGSNVFRNTNGVLIVQGKEQVVLELRAEQHQLLLTMDLYDEGSEQIAHVRRNAWGFNEGDRFGLSAGPDSASLFTPAPWVLVQAKEAAEPVIEARVEDEDTVLIASARFYAHDGQLVEISSHLCRVAGGNAKFGEVADLKGGPVKIS